MECTCNKPLTDIAPAPVEEDGVSAVLHRAPTCKLAEELSRREGVERITIPMNDAYNLNIAYMGEKSYGTKNDFGPALILIIKD